MTHSSITRNNWFHVLIFTGIASASCAKQESNVSVHKEDGVSVRIYSDSYITQRNPFELIEGRIIRLDQSETNYFFSLPHPAALTEDGTLFVSDIREELIYAFSSEGKLLDKFGGRGEGPGEFQSLSTILNDGELLYCPDRNGGRLIVLRRDGTFIRQTRPTTREPLEGHIVLCGNPDSRLFLTSCMVEEVMYERKIRFSLWSESLERIATLLEFPITESPALMRGTPMVPFSSAIIVSAIQSGMPIAWYSGDEARIDFLDPITRERWAAIVPHERVRVSGSMKQQMRRRYEDQSYLEEVRNMRFPDFMPHFESLFWDASARVWAQESIDHTIRTESRQYYLFSAKGEWLCTQEFPILRYFPSTALFTEGGFYLPSTLEDGTPVIQFYMIQGELIP